MELDQLSQAIDQCSAAMGRDQPTAAAVAAEGDDAVASASRTLLEEIKFHRSRESRHVSTLDGMCAEMYKCTIVISFSRSADNEYVMVTSSKLWIDMFVRNFLDADSGLGHDDLLFFVKKTHIRGYRYIPKFEVILLIVVVV